MIRRVLIGTEGVLISTEGVLVRMTRAVGAGAGAGIIRGGSTAGVYMKALQLHP